MRLDSAVAHPAGLAERLTRYRAHLATARREGDTRAVMFWQRWVTLAEAAQ